MGIATHSDDGGATERMADTIVGTGKNYWMTEFRVPGPEDPGDFFRASAEATAFLSDMNHCVSTWIHFIGYLSNDPRGNGTRLMAYHSGNCAGDGWLTVFKPYYYLQQLAQTFDAGAVFLQSISSLESEMTWRRDHTPRLVVAAALNPDGSRGIGLSDYTSDEFPQNGPFVKSIRGKPAQSFTVTAKVEELAEAGELGSMAHRRGSGDRRSESFEFSRGNSEQAA